MSVSTTRVGSALVRMGADDIRAAPPTDRSCFCAVRNGVSAVGHRVNSSFYSMQDRISLLIWFYFDFIFFSFVVSFAISLLFTCLLSLIDDGDESRMNDVSSARNLVDLSWRHSSITSTGNGDSRSKKSINRYNFIKFDNSGAGSGFEKSISWWCRTLDSFVVFRRFGLIWIARASVESFPTAPPLSLSACSTWLFLFVSFQEKKNAWDGERQIYTGEKERKRDEDEREQKQKENGMWQ